MWEARKNGGDDRRDDGITEVAEHSSSSPSSLILYLTIAGGVVGIITGYIVNISNPSKTVIELLSFPGELLLNVLRALVLPLITASLVVGITSLGGSKNTGKLGGYALLFFGLTTIFAASSGIFWVLVVRPGDYGGIDLDDGKPPSVTDKTPLESIMDVLRSMFPKNLVEAAANNNILGIITFTIAFAVVIAIVGEKAKPLANMFEALNVVVMQLVTYVIWFVPIGVCSLIIGKLGGSGEGFWLRLEQLAMYAVTVSIGLAVHILIFMPLFYFLLTRRNPYLLMAKVSQALLIALGTASSAATLPVTAKCCKENAKITEQTVNLVLPLGTTVNMNGTALYEAVACLYVAQSLGIELSLSQMIITALTATLAAVGAAGIPEAGLVTMVMVFSAVGLPLESIGLLASTEWLLDRFRTATNVMGDVFCAAVIDHYHREGNTSSEEVNEGELSRLAGRSDDDVAYYDSFDSRK